MLIKTQDPKMMTNRPYCEIIVSLLWLLNRTPPDVTFSINISSRYMRILSKYHWKAPIHLFLYLKGTTNFPVTLGGIDETLWGLSDSDQGEDRSDWWSTRFSNQKKKFTWILGTSAPTNSFTVFYCIQLHGFDRVSMRSNLATWFPIKSKLNLHSNSNHYPLRP